MTRSHLIILAAFVATFTTQYAVADDPSATALTRAQQWKTIETEFKKAQIDYWKTIQDKKIEPNAEGEYPGWIDLVKEYHKQAQPLIDANPNDEVSLDAILFFVPYLRAKHSGLVPYEILLKHHLASEKLDRIFMVAPNDVLRQLIKKSPHARIRLWSRYHLATSLFDEGKTKEAKQLLDALSKDVGAKELGGYSGTLADSAKRRLFNINHLNVGQKLPEFVGIDLDDKPMKFSETRGKVTLIVFWATWCGPCMDMIPHERKIAKRYADDNFVIVGVNGDLIPEKGYKLVSSDGIEENGKTRQRVEAAVKKERINWRSFRRGIDIDVAQDWDIRTWPTVLLVDEGGIIRGKWSGDPGEKLDAAIEKLIKN